MEYKILHTLVWLLPAFTFTTQELVKLSVSPGIEAECGKQVTLNCNVSSSRKGLLIKHMEWFQSDTSICSVHEEGTVRKNNQSLSDFYCEYEHGQLSLIFTSVKPLERGNYTCKLKSNRGARNADTSVELQECCGVAEGVWTKDRLTCTFNNVYPDGDVHWFHGSHKLSDRSGNQHTSKHVDEEGWLTIQSYLERKSPHVPHNCSLMSTASGRYIASHLVLNPESPSRFRTGNKNRSGVGSHGPVWTLLCISVVLAATLQ